MERFDASAVAKPSSPARRVLRVGLAALLVVEVACSGSIGGDGPGGEGQSGKPGDHPSGNYPQTEVSSSAIRRLSVTELANTLQTTVGIVPDAIERVPPDGLGHSFDRVVNDQTMSPAHYEAYGAIAAEVAATLVADRRLDELVSACPDESIPSLIQAETKMIPGAALSLSPEWAVTTSPNGQHGSTQYAPSPEAVYSHAFPTSGAYEIVFDLNVQGSVGAQVTLDGQSVASESGVSGDTTVVAPVQITEAGSHVIELSLSSGDNNLRVTFEGLIIEGPMTSVPEPPASAVAACADAIVDELAPRAWRRPLSDDERARLGAMYQSISETYRTGDALITLIEAIFASPHFLFLVEIGEPVEGSEGLFRLGPWEIASRLSYAICEQPPDAELLAAAAAGELATAEAIEAQARRLFAEPCARVTVERFLEHWLWLNELPSLTKSQDVFPEFDEAMRDGMVAETEQFLSELVWSEDASIGRLFDARYTWPNAETGGFYDQPGASGQKSELPPERAGILTSPGVLAVTGEFDGTSPVKRGVYILEQILCTELPPPPGDVAIVPPPPDPNLTTRERWAQHSEDPACAGCHQTIDPIGFTLEDFDGIGRHRTQENGHEVDASGGVPPIGIEDGAIVGGAALAQALADSAKVKRCVATQWLRFAFGRLETEADAATLDTLTAAFDATSIREALIAVVTTEAFIHRTEEKE